MARVRLREPAPDFTLESFQGRKVSLSDFRDERHAVLVFNRGFA